MRKKLLVCGISSLAILPGCGGGQVAGLSEAPIVSDCRQSMNLFNQGQFQARATNAAWTKPSRLTLDIVYTNTTKAPLSLSGFGNAQAYGQDYVLLGEDGTRYVSDQQASMQATMQSNSGTYPNPMQNINPGSTVQHRLIFDVPRRNYSLLIERQVIQSMTVLPIGGGVRTVSMQCRLDV